MYLFFIVTHGFASFKGFISSASKVEVQPALLLPHLGTLQTLHMPNDIYRYLHTTSLYASTKITNWPLFKIKRKKLQPTEIAEKYVDL